MFRNLEMRALLPIATLALALSACGGGGGGAPVATTPAATLQAPSITAQPAPQAVNAGQSATLAVNVTGTGLTYQWQRDGKDIAGATAATYTLDDVQLLDAASSFTVVVKNGAGSLTSSAVSLSVSLPKGLSLMAGAPGGPGNLDGADGRFARPIQLALNPTGVLYVTEDPAGLTDGWFIPGAASVLRTVNVATGTIATVTSPALPPGFVAMAFDPAGNRYDATPLAIYKITPAGQRSLFAGSDSAAAAIVDAAGTNARFSKLTGMVADAAGNLYVVDSALLIRKVSPAGAVITVAGDGAGGPGPDRSQDGIGNAATFTQIDHLGADPAGNLVILDNGRLRKMTTAGVVTTPVLTAAGETSPVRFDLNAGGVAADAAGNAYVADGSNCRIRKIAPDGTVTDLAGKFTIGGYANIDGKGAAASFCTGSYTVSHQFTNLVTDSSGNLYVGDVDNRTIRRITLAGDVSTVAGRPRSSTNLDAPGRDARFALEYPTYIPPNGIQPYFELAVDAQGTVYLGQTSRIRKLTREGAVSTLLNVRDLGGTNSPFAGLYAPAGLVYGSGALFASNDVVSRVSATGTLTFLASGTTAGISLPRYLVVDGLGNVIMQDTVPDPSVTGLTSYVVRKVATDGSATNLSHLALFTRVHYADQDGTVWIADFDGALSRVASDGTLTVVRAAAAANGGVPTALTRDRAGNLYVAMHEAANWYSVHKITPSGTDTIIAGTPGSYGVRAGLPGSLGPVDALAVGSDGTVYVMSENAVLRIVQ